MLTSEIIQKLKQVNVSMDGELTTQRAKDVLKAASRAQKNEIDALAGVKRVSINRVYATGNISAKIAIAIAQILNVNPFFLTGEADERGECTDEILNSFLTAQGYADLVEEPAKPARKTRTKKAAVPAVEEPSEAVEETPAVDAPPVPVADSPIADAQTVTPEQTPTDTTQLQVVEMTEEEANLLLHSLFVQAKYSLKSQAILIRVKGLLANEVL